MSQTIQGGSLVTGGNVTANVVTANTVALNNNLNVTGAITANTITANLALNIGSEPVATQADATALAIALG
jgi:cytoskeletal protein CcmA (bactofilin family)